MPTPFVPSPSLGELPVPPPHGPGARELQALRNLSRDTLRRENLSRENLSKDNLSRENLSRENLSIGIFTIISG